MESQGASAPGVMLLTTNLSKPFTRLDKYSNILKELERHTDVRQHSQLPFIFLKMIFFSFVGFHLRQGFSLDNTL